MLRVVVLVSGGGTNLQAIMDAVDNGTITNTEIVGVISNNKNAYALERAAKRGVKNVCVSPKDYATRAEFNDALLTTVDGFEADLLVLAGCYDSGANDRAVSQSHHQRSSIAHSVILWNGILWTEGT